MGRREGVWGGGKECGEEGRSVGRREGVWGGGKECGEAGRREGSVGRRKGESGEEGGSLGSVGASYIIHLGSRAVLRWKCKVPSIALQHWKTYGGVNSTCCLGVLVCRDC